MKPAFNFFLFVIFLMGCREIPSEITKTTLYRDVIQHYNTETISNEKKEAAIFLFKNMLQKHSLIDFNTDSLLTFISDSIEKGELPRINKRTAKILKQKSLLNTNPKIVYDFSIIKSHDLISHINITYNNWKHLAAKSRASYSDYCNFILPYRIKNEPIMKLQTKFLYNQFHSLKDSILKTDSIISTISNYIKSMNFRVNLTLSNHYPHPISPKHVFRLKVVPRCDDLVIALALAFRSIGIPAAYDFTPQWGDHPYYGHSWLAIKWDKKWHAFDAANGTYLNHLYKNESIPKIFRKIFTKTNEIDVTNEYRHTTDLTLHTISTTNRQNKTPAVAVFNKYNGFRIVDFGKKTRKKFVFNNLGRSVVYFSGWEEKGSFTPLADPVFIDSLGNITHLIPDWNNTQTCILYRKYPLTQGNRNRRKEKWSKSISGSWIEASNNHFVTIDTLIIFHNYNSYREETFQLNAKKKYKEVRFRCGPENQIATLKFFDKQHNLLKGKIIHDLGNGFKPEKIFDNDMLTWVWMGNPDRIVSVGYQFNSPQEISAIAVHTRNDGNHIVPGDKYELFVYSNGWQSLGIKVAKKQELKYDNIPSGGLYWLKNLSGGKEELPFMIDSSGNQFWAGQ